MTVFLHFFSLLSQVCRKKVQKNGHENLQLSKHPDFCNYLYSQIGKISPQIQREIGEYCLKQVEAETFHRLQEMEATVEIPHHYIRRMTPMPEAEFNQRKEDAGKKYQEDLSQVREKARDEFQQGGDLQKSVALLLTGLDAALKKHMPGKQQAPHRMLETYAKLFGCKLSENTQEKHLFLKTLQNEVSALVPEEMLPQLIPIFESAAQMPNLLDSVWYVHDKLQKFPESVQNVLWQQAAFSQILRELEYKNAAVLMKEISKQLQGIEMPANQKFELEAALMGMTRNAFQLIDTSRYEGGKPTLSAKEFEQILIDSFLKLTDNQDYFKTEEERNQAFKILQEFAARCGIKLTEKKRGTMDTST